MKKLLLALLVVLIWGNSFAQDWHPFPEGQTAFFAIIPDASSDIKYSNIKTLRIDSIRNLSGEEYYYNMRSPVRIEFDGEYSYYDPYSSWIGKYMKLYPSTCYFADKLGNEYGIDFLRNEASPYLCCEFEDLGYLYAHTSKIEYTEILDGVMDSVKYISFQLYEDYMQNPVYHFIQEKQIILSKNYGIVQTFDFGNMEGLEEIDEKKLIGLEKGNNTYGFLWDFDEMVSTYEVGSEFQIQKSDYEQYYLSHKELTDEKVVYTYQKCNNAQNPSIEEVIKVFHFGKYPGQSIFSGSRGKINYSLYKEEVYDRRTYLVRYYTGMVEDYFQNQYVWKDEFIVSMNGIIPPYKQANEIGEFTYRNHFENPPFEMIYYHKNNVEWGEPYSFMCGVGIEENINNNVAPSPNPTTGIVHLSSSEKIEEVKIYNLNGQLQKEVYKIESGVLDLCDLENGVYLVEISTQNQQINLQKIVIHK